MNLKPQEKTPKELRIRDLFAHKERNHAMIDELDSECWTLDQEIGELLKTMRMEKGLGLRETARLIGISAPYLQDLEGGDRHISEENVEKLLKYF